jgi:hypothetical protein
MTWALDAGEWSASRPGNAFTPGERTPGTHCTGGWVGPRAGLYTEARGKILCLCRGSNPDRPVVQPVVRHYTDWATQLPIQTHKTTLRASERNRRVLRTVVSLCEELLASDRRAREPEEFRAPLHEGSHMKRRFYPKLNKRIGTIVTA